MPAAALAFAALAAPAPASAALTASGPVDPANKAPAFYQDGNGLQLGVCHPGTVNCGPAVPGEDFYYMATSTFTTPSGGVASLILNVTVAPNASGDPAVFNRVRVQLDAFPAPRGGAGSRILTGPGARNASGDPAVFTRVRVQLDASPAGTYSITHPYGTDVVSVPAGRRGRTTIDIGCAVTAVGPCDFAA